MTYETVDMTTCPMDGEPLRLWTHQVNADHVFVHADGTSHGGLLELLEQTPAVSYCAPVLDRWGVPTSVRPELPDESPRFTNDTVTVATAGTLTYAMLADFWQCVAYRHPQPIYETPERLSMSPLNDRSAYADYLTTGQYRLSDGVTAECERVAVRGQMASPVDDGSMFAPALPLAEWLAGR